MVVFLHSIVWGGSCSTGSVNGADKMSGDIGVSLFNRVHINDYGMILN